MPNGLRLRRPRNHDRPAALPAGRDMKGASLAMRLENVRRDAAHWGWFRALLARLLDRTQRWLGIYLFRVNVRPLPSRPSRPEPPDGIRVCVLRLDQALAATADPALDLHPDFVRATMQQGDLVCGAYDGDRLIAYAWRSSVAAPFYEGLWVKVGYHYHYAYRHYVLPEYRGRRVQTAMLQLADRESLKRGCTHEMDISPVPNLASLGAGNALGRKRIGFAGYLTVFGQTFSFMTPRVKDYGVVVFRPHARIPIGLVPERT